MLNRRHCPHTGIFNFFAEAEPFLAIGSVIRTGGPAPYHWRCYVGAQPVAGAAADLRTAERDLLSHYRQSLRDESRRRSGAAVAA